jgi:hypothetical protein
MVEVQVPEPARDTSDGAGWMTGHFFGVTVQLPIIMDDEYQSLIALKLLRSRDKL